VIEAGEGSSVALRCRNRSLKGGEEWRVGGEGSCCVGVSIDCKARHEE
jgi:hypothetical protein